MRGWEHFKTITRHKFLVMKYCFKIGLYKQGILHDLSKYSWTEFRIGCKYYQGNRSPNNAVGRRQGCLPPGSTIMGETSIILNIGWITVFTAIPLSAACPCRENILQKW